MGYRIIQGFLTIEGRSPDGDTVAFYLDENQRADWIWTKTRDGRFPQFNKSFQTNIRLEGIDALELHYTDTLVWPAAKSHQKKELALAARNRMLDLCGFDRSVFEETENHTLRDPTNQLIPAVVAYNGVDPFGRLIGFLFHTNDAPDLSTTNEPEVFLTEDDVGRSINGQLLSLGLVFPTFYGGLYPALRHRLSDLTQLAMHSSNRPIWVHYESFFEMPRKGDLEALKELVIMPKLYRRLFTHLSRNGEVSGFRSFLLDADDTVVDTRNVWLGNFSKFVGVKDISDGDKAAYEVSLKREPHELVMLPG